ncbi:GNAT family N-acetyltransferase [Actinoplanes sp. NPDC051475]|uniref:GNAT family N-acetyltransferase n=1 Tax=Actinoplanes sp. NPDC051475 TaxID=3157225 RepID=UPI00344BB20C
MLTATVRQIRDADWPAVVVLEAAAYRDLGLSERPERLRTRAADATSFVLEADGDIAGYLLAHPLPYGRFPVLAHPGPPPRPTSNLHLHDLVVASGYRRAGAGSRLLEHLLTAARACAYLQVSLVSVAGSDAFWTTHGFRARPEIPVSADYGPGAAYMSRTLEE